jgi:hypothetical protein
LGRNAGGITFLFFAGFGADFIQIQNTNSNNVSQTFYHFVHEKRNPSSAFASDISARATRAYLSWCGLAFSERLRWKEMSRSGKTPATIWGAEGFPLPSVGLLLVMIGLSIFALNMLVISFYLITSLEHLRSPPLAQPHSTFSY